MFKNGKLIKCSSSCRVFMALRWISDEWFSANLTGKLTNSMIFLFLLKVFRFVLLFQCFRGAHVIVGPLCGLIVTLFFLMQQYLCRCYCRLFCTGRKWNAVQLLASRQTPQWTTSRWMCAVLTTLSNVQHTFIISLLHTAVDTNTDIPLHTYGTCWFGRSKLHHMFYLLADAAVRW